MAEELTSGNAEDKYFTVKVDTTSQCKRALTLEVTEEAVQKEKKRIVEKLRKDVEVPGFRKGKVPESYIRKNYGELVHNDAVQNLLSRVYEQAILREHLHPLAEPRFEDLKAEEGAGASVVAHIEVKPEVEVTGYRDVSVEVTKKTVGDDDVEKTLDSIRESMAAYQTVERPAESTDYLVIDFVPYTDAGEIDEGARQSNYGVALDSENLLPEFKSGLVGMKLGEEKEILVRYPDEFPEKNLAGKSRSLLVKVTEVKEKLMPELDDAFAKSVAPDVESIDDLRARIRKDLEHEEETRHKRDVQEKIIDKIIESNAFEVPDAMVENYLTSIVEEDRRRRPHVESEEVRDQEMRGLFREPAIRMVKRYFILESVIKQENITVSEEDLEKKFEILAEGAGQTVEEVRKIFGNSKHLDNLKNELMDQKVLNFLQENAEVKVV
jgi:trigger factor